MNYLLKVGPLVSASEWHPQADQGIIFALLLKLLQRVWEHGSCRGNSRLSQLPCCFLFPKFCFVSRCCSVTACMPGLDKLQTSSSSFLGFRSFPVTWIWAEVGEYDKITGIKIFARSIQVPQSACINPRQKHISIAPQHFQEYRLQPCVQLKVL